MTKTISKQPARNSKRITLTLAALAALAAITLCSNATNRITPQQNKTTKKENHKPFPNHTTNQGFKNQPRNQSQNNKPNQQPQQQKLRETRTGR